jgi:hypothetical protein
MYLMIFVVVALNLCYWKQFAVRVTKVLTMKDVVLVTSLFKSDWSSILWILLSTNERF